MSGRGTLRQTPGGLTENRPAAQGPGWLGSAGGPDWQLASNSPDHQKVTTTDEPDSENEAGAGIRIFPLPWMLLGYQKAESS